MTAWPILQNLFDATLAAARYLCSGGLNLRDQSQVMAAILRYNNSMPYAQNVLGWAAAYATGVVPVDLPPITGPPPPLGDAHLEHPRGSGPGLPMNVNGLPVDDPLARMPLIDFGRTATSPARCSRGWPAPTRAGTGAGATPGCTLPGTGRRARRRGPQPRRRHEPPRCSARHHPPARCRRSRRAGRCRRVIGRRRRPCRRARHRPAGRTAPPSPSEAPPAPATTAPAPQGAGPAPAAA